MQPPVTRSVYVIGGAASGKSTFMAALLARLDVELGELEDLWTEPNSRGSKIVLRGHRFQDGIYLGRMREAHPGTDGLDRVSSVAAVEWARHGDLPKMIVGEGLTLAHAGFLGELPGLVVVYLAADLEEIQRRCAERGTTQHPTFVKNTATRAKNLAAALSCPVLPGDDAELVLDLVALHLEGAYEAELHPARLAWRNPKRVSYPDAAQRALDAYTEVIRKYASKIWPQS